MAVAPIADPIERASLIVNRDDGHPYDAVVPPIVQSSLFTFPSYEELEATFKGDRVRPIYSRGLNPTVQQLEAKLAALEATDEAIGFASGMAAISSTVMTFVRLGDRMICVRHIYPDAYRLFETLLKRWNIAVTYVDGADPAAVEAALPGAALFYMESPTSWMMQAHDVAALAVLARKHQVLSVIDNSWASPVFQQPIALGVDLVVHSASKYIGGHSDTVGGVLSGSKAMMKKIFDSEFLNTGCGIQPFNAWLLIRGLRTMPARLERISRTTREVAAFLKAHPRIEGILFPFDEDFPQYALAKRQMQGACGLLSCYVRASTRAEIVRFCEALKHIMMAVSWGGHESLIIPKCASLSTGDFDPSIPEHRMIRLYTGLEDAGYLIRDLEQAILSAW